MTRAPTASHSEGPLGGEVLVVVSSPGGLVAGVRGAGGGDWRNSRALIGFLNLPPGACGCVVAILFIFILIQAWALNAVLVGLPGGDVDR